MSKLSVSFTFILILFFWPILYAQEKPDSTSFSLPDFKLLRAEEDAKLYRALSDRAEFSFFESIKYLSLNEKGDYYFSFGGQIRTRYESYSNRFWQDDADIDFYSQRVAFHAKVGLSKYIELFSELYNGYVSHEKEFAEYDKLDFFQFFAKVNFSLGGNYQFNIKLGRQELGLGAARLVGIREGPNIRRSFDMVRVEFSKKETKLNFFYGHEVRPEFDAFDNDFTLFDKNVDQPRLWGLYSRFKIKKINGVNELYYLGFNVADAQFIGVSGKETRHSIGLRRHGQMGKHWVYNSEIIFQFGKIGTHNIIAFSIDTDWHYLLLGTKWQWRPGLKLEYTSGDNNAQDEVVNTFNPMFVNPAFYSLAATITPMNLMGVHPSISFVPMDDFRVYVEWAAFWRSSTQDGLFRPTRFINQSFISNADRFIGHQFGLELRYEMNRNLSLDIDLSYFITGSFIEQSDQVAHIFHFAPTLSYKF